MNEKVKEPPSKREKTPDSTFDGGVRFGGLGRLIKKLLDRAQLNFRDAEKELGWNYSTWCRWANNERLIPDDALVKLARAARVDCDKVLAYGIINGLKSHYPDAFAIPEIRAQLHEVLELLEK